MATVDFRATMNVDEIIEALDEFDSQYVNQHIRRKLTKSMNAVAKPRLKNEYSKSSITKALMGGQSTKGIYYKGSKTAVAISGTRTNNRSVRKIPRDKKLFGVARNFADEYERESITMSKAEKSQFIKPPKEGGGNPTRILKKSTSRGEKENVYVRRDPSRYAHLVENAHDLPKGVRTKGNNVVERTTKSVQATLKARLIQELQMSLKKAAARAEAKTK